MADVVSEAHAVEEAEESLTEEEVNLVLDYLHAHKMAFTQEFLRARGLPFSGTKARLRERLEEYLGDGRLSATDLVQLLNNIEGWGNQHIYLYMGPDHLIEPWLDEDSARERLAALGAEDLFNRQRPLVLPEEPTLSSVEWTPERIRFVWIEKRAWEERVAEEDIEEEEMVWRAYRVNVSRGLIAFDWSLVSGQALLMIQRLPKGTTYHLIRDEYERKLDPAIGLDQFEKVHVSRAIKPIEASGEVRRRKLSYQARRGGKATFTSADQSSDTYADAAFERAGQLLREETTGWLGNFYWLSQEGKLDRDLHVQIYAPDQRTAIFGEHNEQDVRYVLSRIQRYCI